MPVYFQWEVWKSKTPYSNYCSFSLFSPSHFSNDIYKACDSWKSLTSWRRRLTRGRRPPASTQSEVLVGDFKFYYYYFFFFPRAWISRCGSTAAEHSDGNQNNSVKHLGFCRSDDKIFRWPMVWAGAALFDLKAAQGLERVVLFLFSFKYTCLSIGELVKQMTGRRNMITRQVLLDWRRSFICNNTERFTHYF